VTEHDIRLLLCDLIELACSLRMSEYGRDVLLMGITLARKGRTDHARRTFWIAAHLAPRKSVRLSLSNAGIWMAEDGIPGSREQARSFLHALHILRGVWRRKPKLWPGEPARSLVDAILRAEDSTAWPILADALEEAGVELPSRCRT
jgi:hypothetical protein